MLCVVVAPPIDTGVMWSGLVALLIEHMKHMSCCLFMSRLIALYSVE